MVGVGGWCQPLRVCGWFMLSCHCFLNWGSLTLDVDSVIHRVVIQRRFYQQWGHRDKARIMIKPISPSRHSPLDPHHHTHHTTSLPSPLISHHFTSIISFITPLHYNHFRCAGSETALAWKDILWITHRPWPAQLGTSKVSMSCSCHSNINL